MNARLTTAAWVTHDLALAAGLGGPLFAKTGLDPAVNTIDSPVEREQVLKASWRLYRWVSGAAIIVTAATWITGRIMLSGRQVKRSSRGLVIAKDVIVGTTVATGLLSWVLSSKMLKSIGPTSMRGGEPALEDSAGNAKVRSALNVLGYVNMACFASLIGLTTVLASQAGQSLPWKATTKFLP